MTTDSKANFSSLLDIIGALQTILARFEQVAIPDLETPCSRFPNTDQSATHEDQSIRAIITERQQQLDRVLREISGLESVMDSIQNIHQQVVEKKDRITESMNLHKGLVSRLWRLPTEVLSQIFHHCLPESSHPSELEAPLLLTGVCRRWREIAINTPSFWCRLSVQIDERYWDGSQLGYDLWLKRSRGRPLSLALFCECDEATIIRSLLEPYINHITSISITFYPGADPLFLDYLPALQELAIQARDEDRDEYIPAMGQSISRLPPTLCSLKVLDAYFCTARLTSFGSVGAHLTNLDIAVLEHQSAVLHLLQLFPNLSSLKIFVEFNQTETLESFTHTNIQTFRILHNCSWTAYLSCLLDALSLPNLRVLEDYCALGVTCPHEQLKAFLARSKCPLESLIFSGLDMPTVTDVQRAEYIDLLPSLDILLVEDRSSAYLWQ